MRRTQKPLLQCNMRKRITVRRKSLSRQCLDNCYLGIVHIGHGDRAPGAGPRTRNDKMTINLNRMLDTLVSFAIVALGLTLAGATAFVGA